MSSMFSNFSFYGFSIATDANIRFIALYQISTNIIGMFKCFEKVDGQAKILLKELE